MLFGTIIDISSDGNVLLNKKYIHLIPEFNDVFNDKNLGGPMIKWIINVYDYNSPFKHLPLDVRKEDMTEMIFGKKKYSRCNHPKVKKAVELYKYVQYNPLREQYDSLVNKNKQKLEIFDLIEVTEKNIQELNNVESKMMASGEKLEALKKRLKVEEEENKMMGTGDSELSFIEERLIKHRKEEYSGG